ncbi:MAG TPA: LysR family transcriptional regulator [Kofleriaceae bacterium]|nr:LysR family transcriptional regulator [Kofleriaceae bacterium]
MKRLADVDLNLLVSLDALLATGSVTAAAQRVGLSKPAMSHALARIRKLLGDEIIVRSGKAWILTDRARELVAPLAAILQSTSALLLAERSLDLRTLDREFRIHSTDHVLSILGVPVGREVGRQAPSAMLRFLPVTPDDVESLRGDIDLGIGVFRDLPSEFRKQALFEDRFCCVVRRDHPQVRGRVSLALYTSLHHVLVAPRGRPGATVDRALGRLGEHRRVSRSLPYFLSALHCVAESDCIATVSIRLARAHAERFGLQIVKPPIELPPYTIEQVWHPRVETDPAHVWMRRLVARVAHALPEPALP